MVFSSLVFICAFLPVVYILNCICTSIRVKNILLVIASLIFYAYGEPVYVALLIISSLINYTGARLLAWGNGAGSRKNQIILAITVIVDLAILFGFKYTGLFFSTVSIPLPIGISFFTFQAISYVVDVYNGRVEAQKNWGKLLLYISFFPQLIAGPIVKYRDISNEIDNRKMNSQDAAAGMQRFIRGLAKKVLIANTMGRVADCIFMAAPDRVNIIAAWLGAIAYMMQIYFDFSGYSDMAIGLGKMFGFHFKENFMYPYGATSIKDFWHKWHISLSGWFKEYLYIPLGGNRKGKVRTNVNKLIVFFCTGLWHGANWTFVIWGLYHGAFLLLEDNVKAFKKMPQVLGHIYTCLVVCVGFVIFRADTITQGAAMIGKMFTGFSLQPAAMSLVVQQLTPVTIAGLVAAVFFAAPVKPLADRISASIQRNARLAWLGRIGQLMSMLLLCWCLIRLSGSTYNPFIYFRF